MVRIIVVKFALIIFILLLTNCTSTKKIGVYDDILEYENYGRNQLVVRNELFLSEGSNYYFDSILIKKDSLLKIPQKKITGELFDRLCRIEMINQRDLYYNSEISPPGSNYEHFVKKRKEEIQLFYLGRLKVSNNFNSFLVLVTNSKHDNYNFIKSVLLINAARNRIASITRMSVYTCYDGTCLHIYTIMAENGVFIQQDKEVSSDAIFAKGLQQLEEIERIKFTYNKNGFLKRLSIQTKQE